MATIDELVYPDAQQEADSEHLRARALQTLRLLRAQEIAAFQEFGRELSERVATSPNPAPATAIGAYHGLS